MAAVMLSGAGPLEARQQSRGNDAPPVPLKVTVNISRYEGEKKTASLPFVLWVNTGDSGTIQMGSDVPVPTTTLSPVSTNAALSTPVMSFTYKSLGTNITCLAAALGDGLFRLALTVNDSQVFRQTTPGALGPIFQSFKATNSPILRDGQTAQFAVATDKTSGEVIKLDVTLNLVK
jgi:hypothetical protein